MKITRWLVAGAAAAALVLSTSTAWAHVVADPDEAAPGGFAVISFNTPNEESDANTVKLEVQLPTDTPIPFVSTEPVPGWTAETETTTLDTPIPSDEGDDITEVVSKITWTATGDGIAPGEFQQFPVSMGPFPDDVDHVVFKAVQTYDNGDVVRWIEEQADGAEEPEHPAPVVTLTADAASSHEHDAAAGDTTDTTADSSHDAGATEEASTEATTAQDDADTAKTLATIAIVVGLLGLIAGGAAIALARKKGSASA